MGTNETLFVVGALFFVSEFCLICLIVALTSFEIGLFVGHLCPGFGPLVFPLSGAFEWGLWVGRDAYARVALACQIGPYMNGMEVGNPSQRADVTSVEAPPSTDQVGAGPRFRFSPK